MPLINGIKMACEPCIRGHRSTKCTHANERLMVPVRKPGRPLSTCPHPASRPCSCGRVTAAIPKKQACHCGPSKDTESPKPENSDSTSSSTPQSPVSKTPGSGYRVQKTSSKGGSSSRRESVDPSAFQRMDPKMLNILPSFEDISQKPATSLPDMSPYGSVGMTPADGPFGPVMYPMFQPHIPPPMMSPGTSKETIAGQSGSITSTQVLEQPIQSTPKAGSCCGGGNSNNIASVPITMPSVPSPPKVKAKSCCSSSNDSPKLDQKNDNVPTNDIPTPNSMMMSPFPTPIMMPNGMYAYYPQPTVFTYPPQYGSYLQPLQPEQWRQVMATMTFAGQGGMPSPFGMHGATPFPSPTAPQTPHSATGTSHQCSCGASCECVGCAAHPYNEATQNYVRSAWQSMMDTGYTHVNGHGNGETPTTNGHSVTTSTASVPPIGSTDGTVSPIAPQTPSEAASGISEEQALSANDFFFSQGVEMDRSNRVRERSPHRDYNYRRSQDRDTLYKNKRSRSRSRSPDNKRSRTSSYRHERHQSEPSGRRSSPKHHHRHHSSHKSRDHASRKPEVVVNLPFKARPLSKADLPSFKPLFGEYLSLQKQKNIAEMDDHEVRGRWKSFIGKWNRKELAEGWYDPETFARITSNNPVAPQARRASVQRDEVREPMNDREDRESEDDEDDYGPPLPGSDHTRRSGPGIPTLQDLSLRAEVAEEDKQASIADLREARKADRALQKERLEDLVPRAEAGTRERMLEKKAAVADKMRSFRDKSPDAMEVKDERELMGGGDSLDEYKKAKEREQRRKTEREIRREEIERAKREEVEEKKRAWREREEGTVSMLRELARQRFG
ncbi:copper-activated transcription factor [Fusarium tjaetaba]|uniref:Copper-activated transcription factor n=1 Tax=Fusarium tjaetaba TaxID=1567544 RepID=A0A8H5R8M2_9HYPO|nr:copper-activated transcription factor [Fusarium tjaetaba]KAF5628545.1 copper-activated transcription factor [Fusarium tjaetaba]